MYNYFYHKFCLLNEGCSRTDGHEFLHNPTHIREAIVMFYFKKLIRRLLLKKLFMLIDTLIEKYGCLIKFKI